MKVKSDKEEGGIIDCVVKTLTIRFLIIVNKSTSAIYEFLLGLSILIKI